MLAILFRDFSTKRGQREELCKFRFKPSTKEGNLAKQATTTRVALAESGKTRLRFWTNSGLLPPLGRDLHFRDFSSVPQLSGFEFEL